MIYLGNQQVGIVQEIRDMSSIAATFDSTVNYSVGDYVSYGDTLYKFTTTHTAGAWNAEHVTEVTVGEELTGLQTQQDIATFYGLTKAAGVDMASSSNPVGTYTDEAKVAIQKMLGIYEAPWELIREDTFTNASAAAHEITVDSAGQAFELTDVILMFETQKQETDASFVGQIWLSPNNHVSFLSEFSSYTQAANTSGHGCAVVMKQDSNMLELYRINTITTSNTAAIGMRYGEYFGIDRNTDRIMFMLATTPVTIYRIKIGNVLGTGHYYLYGKRKWN